MRSRLSLSLLALSCALVSAACGGPAPDVLSTQTQAVPLAPAKLVRSAEPVPGQYIVLLAAPKTAAAPDPVPSVAAELLARHGGEVLHVYEHALRGFSVRLTEAQALALAADPAVAMVEEDGVARLPSDGAPVGKVVPSTVQTGAVWSLDRIDQRQLPLDTNYTYFATAAASHVYVIDTGIRITHQEFEGRASADFNSTGDGNMLDCNGHGTHIAGVIGGKLYGAAKQVRLHSVKVLTCSGSGTTSGIMAGVDWVTVNRVNPAVANMSLGGPPSPALDAIIQASVAAGVTYVASAGHTATDACNVSPARVPEAITVGYSTASDTVASFSNVGPCIDLFAPGQNITGATHTSDTATTTISGSAAASYVTAAAAMYLEVDPGASPATVTAAILNNATANALNPAPPLPAPNRLLYTGFIGQRLSNGIAVSGLSHPLGEVRYFSLAVPAGRTTLDFSISGGTGDADLYVRHGALPTLTAFNCRPYLNGNVETCSFTSPAAGTWYVMLRAWAPYSGVNLVGRYTP